MTYFYLILAFSMGAIIGFVALYLYQKIYCNKQSIFQWQETFDAIHDPIAILDSKGKILKSNKAMQDFTCQSNTGLYCYKLIHKTNTHIPNCPLVRSILSSQHEEMELTMNGKTLLVSIDPIKRNHAYVHIMKDVTKIKDIQKKLEEEKRKFETLVNNLPGFVYRCANDKNWTMQYISNGICSITGYTAEELIDNKRLSFNDMIAKEYREKLWEKWQKVLNEKSTFEDEYEIITKWGEKRWVWERGQGVYDDQGNILFLEGFITDITDKNKIFNALQESEEKFRALTDSTTASIFIYQNEKFIYLNPATEHLTGYSIDELLKLKFWDIVHSDHKEMVKERGKMRLSGIPQPPNYDFKIVRKNGEERWIKFSAGYIKNYNGQPASIGTAIDITELIEIQNKLQESIAQLEEGEKMLKQQNEEYLSLNEELKQNNQNMHKLNEELIKAKEKAEASDRLKTSFLNNISHEIRTPLNAILGFSELLKKKNLIEEKQNQYLNIIQASGNHLLSIITNIINTATIEAGEEKIYYQKINLNVLIENTIKSLNVLTIKKNIEILMTEKLKEEKSWLLSDETKLHQIISNLLTNSIKFTEKGYIHIAVKEKNDKIIISVKDTGIGIEENLQPYIFERFVKIGDIIKKHASNGMGLGLSLVKSYVQLLNGTIELYSKVGEGTEFIITLPYLPVTDINEKASYKSTFNLPANKKIILAEDINTNIELIKEYLLPYKINLLLAFNGQEAVELAEKNPDTNLILMDIKMPEMDGYEACLKIKEILKGIPIIGLTAYSQEEEFKKMSDCGMVSYITKPIDFNTFLATLEEYLK